MAQYDVHRLRSGELVLDCQSNVLSTLQTRLVAPLVEPDSVPAALTRLHPVFDIEGRPLLLATHLAASIPARELGVPIVSLADDGFTITNAFDVLLTGV